jgi:hypothetical protein
MGKRRRKLEVAALERHPPDDLRLPSLIADKRLEGHALRYTIILPLLSERGDLEPATRPRRDCRSPA